MDWTQMYADDGLSTADASLLETRASRQEKDHGYGSFIAFCITLNYVLGVGALAIPYSFSESGVALGAFLLIVASLFNMLTITWLVEICARAQIFNRRTPSTTSHLLSLLDVEQQTVYATFRDSQTENKDGTDEKTTTESQPNVLFGLIDDRSTGAFHDEEEEEEEEEGGGGSWGGRFGGSSTSGSSASSLASSSSSRSSLESRTMRSSKKKPVKVEERKASPERITSNFRIKSIIKKYEVTQLCDVFLGSWGKFGYQLSLSMLMYTGLWAYSAVFTQSVKEVFSFPFLNHAGHDYSPYFFNGIFGLVAVPLSCMDLTEQKYVQAFLTSARFVTFAIMIVTPIYGIFNDPWSNDLIPINHFEGGNNTLINGTMTNVTGTLIATLADDDSPTPPYFGNFIWADWKSFGLVLTTVVFSFLFQHSVPGLIAPIKKKHKVNKIFGSALFTTVFLYLCLGVVCALYFGTTTKNSVNLNWTGFRYGIDPKTPLPWWTIVLNDIVILFPAIDTFSVYPLIAVTLGNSIDYLCINYGFEKHVPPSKLKLLCRLLASVPPILASMFYDEIQNILVTSGVFGMYVAFVTPCLLMIFSERKCNELGSFGAGPSFSTHFSHRFYIYLTLVFSLVSFIFVFIGLFSSVL